MKKNYETLMLRVITLSVEDVATASPASFPTDENELPFVGFN